MAVIIDRLLPVFLIFTKIYAEHNYLKNPGFESLSNWDCYSCTGSLSSDSHGGSHSYKVSGRKYEWTGASQEIPLPSDRTYFFRAWIKILNTANGKMYHNMDSMIDMLDTNGKHTYDATGITRFVQPGSWHLVGGDYYIPANIKSVRFYVKTKDIDVNFLIDDAEITWIDHSSSFLTDANHRIDLLRKSDISVRLNAPELLSDIKIEVQQTSSEFGWGSAIAMYDIVSPTMTKYQDFFYNLFEWAVLEYGMKWFELEKIQGKPNYDAPLRAVNSLLARGIKVRGHNIFWGGETVVPSWQKNMAPAKLKSELQKHIQEMTSKFKGKFQHWDVENENLHLHFYEEKLHDANITQWMFREVHRLDSQTKCFLNDYDVVGSRMSTLAYEDQALHFKESGVPVAGMGIQSHLGSYIDISVIKHRLDEAAKVGLPIWITELDIVEPDEHKKSKKYEDVLRLYFSHPAVHGVMFWGFWDHHHWKPTAAIANGINVTPNAAGRKVEELLKVTWRTNESHNIKHGQTVRIRGFMGSYKLLLHHKSKIIHTQNFILGHGEKNLRINLTGSDSNLHVTNVLIG